MKKIFWLGLGITVGVLAARKVAAAKGAIGPDGLNRAVGRAADAVHDFADALRENMDHRESELRGALGLDPDRPVGPRH
ncbi:uncharacterized protein with PhoU and TrkA domain [Arthrobacter silviterrae]|uniref:Secreted protein n=1 Tax=Arthrobacter silviterrae TaxID=2026658 RepID=A0ABX0DDK6_9MICC|nr:MULTISPECIES: hypothetical protein [Arthrobacter]MCU6478790.1 hypothetical protein [Arthrobacter sp. A2-55]MDQ0276314.1 uncharacterized protein with PhoU and TrkA domain [Arthrobacter silviterrae]NGN82505.1 hypothetical protein [Arthrobacter silviterrae]